MELLPRRRALKKDLEELMGSERQIDSFDAERPRRNIGQENVQFIFNSNITSEESESDSSESGKVTESDRYSSESQIDLNDIRVIKSVT